MKRILQVTILFFSGLLMIGGSGCEYNKEDELYPGTTPCDTTAAPSYVGSVVPILNSNCNGCHGGAATAGAGIKLDTYTGVKGKVTDGKLLLSINHQSGASPMPKNGAKLSACNIAKIRRWVTAGAPDN